MVATAKVNDAKPTSRGCLAASFFIIAFPGRDVMLEGGGYANADGFAAGIRTAVDAPILVARVAGRAGDVGVRQRWVEARVSGDGEQVLRLHVDLRRRQPVEH